MRIKKKTICTFVCFAESSLPQTKIKKFKKIQDGLWRLNR